MAAGPLNNHKKVNRRKTMERNCQTQPLVTLCPHLAAACIYTTAPIRRETCLPPPSGILAQLAEEGLLS
jgi:hypothetical protein